MILEDLEHFSIFSGESVTVMTGKCYGIKKKNTSSINCLRLFEKYIIPRGVSTCSPVAATRLQIWFTNLWENTAFTSISPPQIKSNNRSPHAPVGYRKIILKYTSQLCKVNHSISTLATILMAKYESRQAWEVTMTCKSITITRYMLRLVDESDHWNNWNNFSTSLINKFSYLMHGSYLGHTFRHQNNSTNSLTFSWTMWRMLNGLGTTFATQMDWKQELMQEEVCRTHAE